MPKPALTQLCCSCAQVESVLEGVAEEEDAEGVAEEEVFLAEIAART